MAEPTTSQDAPVADRVEPGGSGSADSWMVRVTLLWMAGLLAGAATGWAALWLIVTGVIVVVAVIMYMRRGPATAMRWAMVGVVSAGAAWFVVRQHHVRADHIGQYATARPQLAQVTGVIHDSPYVRQAQSGRFASFSYEPPTTLALLAVDSIRIGDSVEPCSGRVLLKIAQAQYRLREGDRIEAAGWLSAIRGPLNPGEFDYRRYCRKHGIAARLTLEGGGNLRVLERPAVWASFRGVRGYMSNTSAAILRDGMPQDPQRQALLETILLGRRSAVLRDLTESFRRVGLVHLLAISGTFYILDNKVVSPVFAMFYQIFILNHSGAVLLPPFSRGASVSAN